jgi:asparagine synthase (glutamine-hydrolysing)
MCGIIGIIGENIEKINKTELSAMLFSLSKRGPDDSGLMSFPSCLLGQTRLSIIDLSTGNQPMKDIIRDFAITFNGEIYNYRELKKTLEEKGHRFSTASDTEVILKAYAEYGTECPKYLDGMFAFAIWDNEKKHLFVARDRFGKKPFYYAYDDDKNFIFASEIKAIFASERIKGKIDPKAIDDYLRLMYIPPWKTLYSNIKTLPPAHFGTVKDGKITISRYWQLENKPIDISYDEAKEEIKRLFNSAVKKRMIADVEIGALLSGGVDSTLVIAYAQKYASHPIKTFALGYGEHINELPYAKQASEKIGTDHHTFNATENLTDELKKIISYMDEPHADTSNFPQHLISELVSSKVKVALTGDGADELFMGYGWYWKYWNTRKIVRLKNMFFSTQYREHLKNMSIFSKKDRQQLWKETDSINENFEKECFGKSEKNNVKKINLFDLTTYLPGQLLTKIDRTSMMHSLEVRSPFLDYQLAEFVYNLPEKYKMDKKSGKIILKDILAEIMPKEFVYRRKQGFGAPINAWLREKKMEKLVKNTLNNNSPIYSYLKKEEVAKIIEKFYTKKDESYSYKIWSLLCLNLWFILHYNDYE